MFMSRARKSASSRVAPQPSTTPVQKRVGLFAGADRAYRTVQSLQKALETEVPEQLAQYVEALANARIDGRAATLLTGEDMQALLPSTPLGERLSLLHYCRSLSMEPAPEPPEDKMAERFVAHVVAGGKGAVRDGNDLAALTCALLATISGAALLMPQCSLGGTEIECTALQGADMIAWSVTFSVQALTVCLAFYHVGGIMAMLDEDTYKTWLLLNWRKAQLPIALAIVSFTMLMPVAVILRAWLLAPSHDAGAVTGIVVLFMFLIPNNWWDPAARSAFKLLPIWSGVEPTRAKIDALSLTAGGLGNPPNFSRLLREA